MPAGIIHQLGFSRPHILARIEHFRDSSNPLFDCLFLPVGESPAAIQNFTSVPVPIGQLVDLRLGDVLHPTGEVTLNSRMNTYTTSVEVGGGRALSGERSLIAEQGLLRSSSVDYDIGRSRSCWHALPAHDKEVAWVLAPAVTVFQTYFANSSGMAQAYFSAEILDILSSLRDSKETHRDSSGACHFSLPRSHLMSDIVPLARLLFDDGTAHKSLIRTVNTAMLSRRRSETAALDCPFPFAGTVTLQYRGVEYEAPNGERIRLALSIEECSFPLPWTELIVKLPQNRYCRVGPNSDACLSSYRFGDFEDEFIPLDPASPAPKPNEIVVARSRHKTAFPCPGPRAIATIRLDEVESSYYERRDEGERRSEKKSASKSSSDGSENIQQVHVAPQPDKYNATAEGQSNETPSSPSEAFQYVVDNLLALRDIDLCSVEPIALTPKLVTFKNWLLNEIPHKPKAPRKAWETICHGKVRRCLLIYCVAYASRHAYVFEILRNPGENFSTLIVSADHGAPIGEDDLRKLFRAIWTQNGLPSDRTMEGLTKATVTRVRHPPPRCSNRTAERLRHIAIAVLQQCN